MPVVETIIRFLGLCLFSQSIPNDPGIHVLLPHIDPPMIFVQDRAAFTQRYSTDFKIEAAPTTTAGKPAPAPATPASKPAPPPTQASMPGGAGSRDMHAATGFRMRGVEAHLAGIAFPAANYVQSSTWKAQPLAGTTLLYVPLAGERVQFVTTAPNVAASMTALDLPKLSTCCSSIGAPSAQSAQAVIDISKGMLTACGGKPIGGKGRVDTEWRLKHNAALTIRGTKGTTTKEVRLTGAPTIVVFNIPPRVLGGDYSVKPPGAVDGVPHQHAYYQMSGSNCTASLESCVTMSALPYCQSCGIGVIDSPPAGKSSVVDFQCSNSQWP